MVSQLLHLPRTKSTPETEVQEIVVIRRGFRDSGSQASLLFTVAAGLDWRRLDKLPKVVLLVNSVAEEKEETCVKDLRWIKIGCPIVGHTGKLLEARYESVGDRIVRRWVQSLSEDRVSPLSVTGKLDIPSFRRSPSCADRCTEITAQKNTRPFTRLAADWPTRSY